MRKLLPFIMITAFALVGCNGIPNKPITKDLSLKELAKAIEEDPSFSDFYTTVNLKVSVMVDADKAVYNKLSYRRLFKFFNYERDSSYWKPLIAEWDKEWADKYGATAIKTDSLISQWRKKVCTSIGEEPQDFYSFNMRIFGSFTKINWRELEVPGTIKDYFYSENCNVFNNREESMLLKGNSEGYVLRELSKERIAQALVDNNYEIKEMYTSIKRRDTEIKKDKLCFEFLH